MPADDAPTLDELVRLVSERLPSALVATDFDGTLAPIVDDPATARALPEAVEALRSLAGIPGTRVAVISGRSLSDLRMLLGDTDALELVGSHGAEVSAPDKHGANGESQHAEHTGRSELSPTAATRLAKLRRVLQGITSQYGGINLEPKPTGIAVHLRNADERDARAVTAAIEEDPATWAGVHLLRGKKVLELTVVATDKGRALQNLVHKHHSTATLFLGDDITDENAFLSLNPPDVGIKVGNGSTAADVRIADPARVSDVLHVLEAARRRARAGLRPESHEN